MSHVDELPQLGDAVFLTDGGLETDLIFHHGLDLPEFASFVLLDDAASTEVMRGYFREYLRVASTYGHGLVLETPTWRASADWGTKLGHDTAALRDDNLRGVELLADLRREADGEVVISGCVGPRGDAYADLGSMAADEARAYHRPQIEVLAGAGADLVSALTLTNVAEAVGVVRAAQDCKVPVVISFTVETDGALPDGTALAEAIAAVDDATEQAAAYFMVNCAHVDHFGAVVAGDDASLERIRGARANASRQSHAELDESEELDDGDPTEFGAQFAGLHQATPGLSILGGCCGSDVRHIEQIAIALAGG